jgi:hypothetical protein
LGRTAHPRRVTQARYRRRPDDRGKIHGEEKAATVTELVPNAVTDEMFAELRQHWTEEQIIEIVGVIALFGFLNRWNDTLATPLEDEPIEVGQKYLSRGGWEIGKHHR